MATIAIVYGGAHAAVEIAATEQVADNGTPLDVEESVAKRLLEQSTWTKAPAKAAKKENA